MGLPSKDPYGMPEEGDPYGYGNPHRRGCKLCNRVKRTVKVPHDNSVGYFLIRICDRCDKVSR